MKTVFVLLLLLGGAALLIRQKQLSADPSGAITAHQTRADTVAQAELRVDPSGALLLATQK